MVKEKNESGFILVELFIAIAILAVVMSFALQGESGHLRHAVTEFDQTVACHVASSRLEVLRGTDEALVEGVTSFAVPSELHLVEAIGRQTTTRIEPGLFGVTTEVSWLPAGAPRGDGHQTLARRRVRLTTWIRREVVR